MLTANNSSLRQIAGDAAPLVDAAEVEDISRGLMDALQEDSLITMAKKGEERVKLFQWPIVADRTIELIHHLGMTKAEDKDLPRLAFFSPLPPQQSGIADYSVDILSVLADQFLIDVYIDDGYQAECALPDGIRILNHREFTNNATQYDYVLYQMGNSLFHYYMYPYLRRYGGILVLHDYNMHGVAQAIGMVKKKDNFKTYAEYLREDLTEKETDNCIRQCRDGIWPDLAIEINGFVTNYADKIIVHSRFAMEGLLRKNIGRTVTRIPHYAAISPLVDSASAKEELGIDPRHLVFAAFGHIHETKRAIPLLKAGIRFLKDYQEAELIFVGKLDESLKKEFDRVRHNSSVEDRIKVTGYTALDEFCKYIDATDVCFNLRYPYNGENSGSLARIMSRGKCVVVNEVGSFGELPDDSCVKLPPADSMKPAKEENSIYQTMCRLAALPALRKELGAAARAYAEKELDLNIIGMKYAKFIHSPTKNNINENLLRRIQYEMTKNRYSDDEIRGIARTLAYCVE